MNVRESKGRILFQICNMIVLSIMTLVCILPFIHLLAVSFSSQEATTAGIVGLWPKEFGWEAYQYLLQKQEFFRSMGITLVRVVLGTAIGMTLTVLTAYPLSKETSRFKQRPLYVCFLAFTMFFSGGMIPAYMVIKELKLIDTMWALVLPTAMNVWNIILLLNFFRQIPKDLEEAALLDGAGQAYILGKIYLPVSLPSLATVLLFTIVTHWNAWFDGVMYINTTSKYPLQTYLSTIILDTNAMSNMMMTPEQMELLDRVGSQNLQAAQVFVGALPILLVYPFLQRYFMKGIVVGSVKG